MTSANYVKGIITIHTTEASNSPRIDFDDIKNLNIHEVENYGATGTVQLVNDYTQDAKNLLSSQCNLWSDGTRRKLDRAMFLRVYHNERTTANAIGIYLITKIQASDELLTLTFCDALQFLRSTGADYVRNHYQAGAKLWHDESAIWETESGYITKPPTITVLGGSVGDVKMNVPYAVDDEPETETLKRISSRGEDFVLNMANVMGSETVNYIAKLTIPLHFRYTGGGITLPGNLTISVGTMQGESDLDRNLCVLTHFTKKMHEVVFSAPVRIDRNTKIYVRIEKNVLSATGDYYCYEGAICDLAVKYDLLRQTTNVTGAEDPLDPNKWRVTNIDDRAPVSDDFLGWPGQVQLYYVDPGMKIPAISIMERILDDANMVLESLAPNTRDVSLFRCNGNYHHNYLLTLADMPTDEGRQLSMSSDSAVWNKIHVAHRYRVDDPDTADAAQVDLFYSKDDLGTGMVFKTFNPSISMQNHPSLVVAKGTTSDERPLMVAIPDVEVGIGATLPVVSGSATNVMDVALQAYKNVITNRSKNWDGLMTIVGIDRRFMTKNGSISGGIPVTITDDRYGFDAKLARIKEVKYDYHNQTTTLTINNYSEVYSNTILDTEKMAYVAGDLSSESTNRDMFVRQFVSVIANAVLPTDCNSITIYSTDGQSGTITGDAIAVIRLPELGIAIVNGYFPVGVCTTTEQYGINRIKVGNGATITIPQSRRPDKDEIQSLIVNVIYRLS